MLSQPSPKHRSWAEIRPDAVVHNCTAIRNSLSADTALIAVVKANAYGHGAPEIASALEGRADYFMVAEINEALKLRQTGIRTPILIAGYTDPAYAPLLCENQLTQCVFSLSYAQSLSQHLPPSQTLRCHLKLDTGMGRLGVSPAREELSFLAKALSSLKGLHWEGVFSHFAQSEVEDVAYTRLQQTRFLEALSVLEEEGFHFSYRHLNNSAASLLGLTTNTNAARVGLSLYGAYPSDYIKKKWTEDPRRLPLQPAMAFKTRILQIHRLVPGESVGYNRRFVAQEPATVAVLAAGYADGIPRSLSRAPGAPVIARGIHLVGSVCMDMCFADVSGFDNDFQCGDEVTLFGNEITADDWAFHASTISYEIFCNLSSRVPRIYL